MRQGASADNNPAEAELLKSRESTASEKNNIPKAKGNDIIDVILRAVDAVSAAALMLLVARLPVITGRMLTPKAAVIPAGKLKIVIAYPEYAPYSHLAPERFILRVSLIP